VASDHTEAAVATEAVPIKKAEVAQSEEGTRRTSITTAEHVAVINAAKQKTAQILATSTASNSDVAATQSALQNFLEEHPDLPAVIAPILDGSGQLTNSFTINGQRVQMAVKGDNLLVRVGGGFITLQEFLERHANQMGLHRTSSQNASSMHIGSFVAGIVQHHE